MNISAITNSTLISNSTLYIGNCLLVDPDGYPYVEWMYNSMGQCVHSPLEQSSFYVGLASLALYIVSGIPQVAQNFIKGNADGLSPYTLAMFIIGDSSNLLGALLTNQLFTQILLAIYFVTIEIILIAQFIGYKLRDLYRRRKHNKEQESILEDDRKNTNTCSSLTLTPLEEHNHVDFTSEHEPAFNSDKEMKQVNSTFNVSIFVLVLVFIFVMGSSSTWNQSTDSISNQMVYGRKLLSMSEEITIKDHNSVEFPPKAQEAIIGYSIGFISTCCSIGSRFAQIFKNFSRGNTIGMNPLLFGCSVIGNIFYSSSIFLFSVDSSFLLNKIPWLTSSLVNICLDSIIIVQYVFYTFIRKVKQVEKQEEKIENEESKNSTVERKLKELEV